MAGADWQRIAAERRRLEIAARKANDEEHRDPELEAAFIAWATHRAEGGSMKFEEYRRERLKAQEATDGR